MPDLNPNIILSGSPDPQPIDPLGMLTKIQGLRAAQNQNALLSQTLDARAAIGPMYAAAYDPSSGTFNQSKLIGSMASDPRTAWMVPEGIKESQAATQGNLLNQRSSSDLAQSQVANVAPTVGTLPDGATSDDAKTALNLAVKTGQISNDRAAAITGTMPDSTSDPDGFKAWRNNYFRDPALGAQGALDVQHPPVVSVDDGSATNLVRAPNRYDGAPGAVLFSIPNKLSPTVKASRTTVLDPNNIPQSVPTSALVDAYGNPISSPLAPGGVARVGMKPGANAAADAAATGSAGILNADLTAANTSSDRLFQLNKALTSLQGAQTGPGADQRNMIKSFLLSIAPAELQRFGVTQDQVNSVKDFDEANKYLTQYAAGSASAYGPSTDSKLATALSGNANTHISNLAAQDVVKANIGLERMKQAKIAAWNAASAASGGVLGPQDYAGWSANWNRTADPRAYSIDLLSPQQRKTAIDSMTPAERSNFFRNYTNAQASGVLTGGSQ